MNRITLAALVALTGCNMIENQVAKDAEAQYEIAARSGSPVDKCVHAGLVAAAYIQAKDDAAYAKWKAKERRDCEAAGVPGE